MRTFVQKQNQPQERVSSSLARSDTAILGQDIHSHSTLHLQRTIGIHVVQRMLQTNAEELEVGLARTASPLLGHDFSRIPIHPPPAAAIQTKLAINKPGDEFEQEADRVSEQVMRIPEPQLQRACPCGGGCPKCQTEQPGREPESLQTKRVQANDTGQIAAPPIVHEVLRSPGHPLDPATRAFMEPRFGHDFSRVRVYTGAAAEQSAQDVNAHAYTVGHNVVFGSGRFTPETQQGRLLLAHELTHVVQQRSHPVHANHGSKTVQRVPKKTQVPPPTPPPVPQPIRQIIPGSTHLSRQAQAYRIDNPNLPATANLLVVDYETAKFGRQIRVIENRPGVAHSEAEMDEFLRGVRRAARGEVTVHEIYLERQPCGPSDSDCEGMLRKRYPTAKTTFGYGYQETEAPARESRAARSRTNIAAAHERLTRTRQLEWDFPGKGPPPHFERNEPGPIKPRPRRFYRVGSRFSLSRLPGAARAAVGRAAGQAAGIAIELLIQHLGISKEEYESEFSGKVENLQPEIDTQIGDLSATVLALQRRGGIAYANITLSVTSMSAGGVPFLGRVSLDKVAVSDWFKESAIPKNPSAFEYLATREGVGMVYFTYSEAVGLHPDLLDEALDRIETRLQAIERQIPLTFSPDIKATLEKEHQALMRCLAKLLGDEGVPSFEMLSGACSDAINPPHK